MSRIVVIAAFRLCTVTLLISSLCVPGNADDVRTRYFEGLRQRRLFSLIEAECHKRLGEAEIPRSEKTFYTIQLARAYADHAQNVPENESRELWQLAESLLNELIQAAPDNPDRWQLEAVRALVPAARAEHAYWLAELYPVDLQRRADAIKQLTEIQPALVTVDKTLGARITGDAAAHRVQALHAEVRFARARALVHTAQLNTSDRNARTRALDDAKPLLVDIGRQGPEIRFAWESKVLLVAGERLRGNLGKAKSLIAKLIESSPPRVVVDQILAEQMRIALDAEEFLEASEILLSRIRTGPPLAGELHFLNVRILLALRDIALNKQNEALAEELLQRIEHDVAVAEREATGYWVVRCHQLLERARLTTQYGAELAESIQRSRALYAARRYPEAADEYASATTAAMRAGHSDLAFDLGFTRASILYHAADYGPAAAGFHELATRFPEHPKTPAAHLLYSVSLGKQYAARRTQQHREAYQAALIEHRRQFPEDASVHEATWMLARFEEERRQASKALALYAEIPPESTRGPAAEVGIARCYEQILNYLRHEAENIDPALLEQWENRAADDLWARTTHHLQDLTVDQAEVALRLARIQLSRGVPNYVSADALLRVVGERAEATRSTTTTPEPARQRWKSLHHTATQLRVVSLAGQKQMGAAHTLVKQLAADSTSEILGVLDGLSRVAAELDPRRRSEVGLLQLETAESLEQRRQELTDAERDQLDRCRAEAYATTKQYPPAIRLYEALRERHPEDRQILRQLAEWQLACGSLQCLEAAESNWRKLERFEQRGSPAWIAVRLMVATCQYERKDYTGAQKTLGVTRLLYRDRFDADSDSRWRELDEKVRKATKP